MKKKIKGFVDGRVKLIKDQELKNQQTNFNYNLFSNLFNEESFIPFSTWSISPNTILHILNDITINQRQNIIEFGAGASTFYIAKLIKVLKFNSVFFSVESDEKWAAEIQRQLELYQLENYVKIIYAPLNEIQPKLAYNEQKIWYDIKILDKYMHDIENVDLVVVDGPFGGSTPYARYSAIPFLRKKLTESYSIFLDDVNRSQEREIINQWSTSLNKKVKYFDRYAIITSETNFEATPFQLTNLPL
ncbi:class I SAM-dependent methyltransferase [Salegentibacter holothuriorum]|uniref:class I SAM-dependent methyltransferase n=1 Tax=Salegentibacter holothuriorum TaxID=241145 RepID=UPI001116FBFD|nr:class I SAM-dependent methyltransferase [Salegentibacter holothuriorum]